MKSDAEIIEIWKSWLLVIFFFSVIIIPFSYNFYMDIKKTEEIKKNKKITIGQFSSIEKYGKSKSKFIKFYVNKKFYRAEIGKALGIDKAKLKKYYIVYYSKLNPENFEVDFTKEIKDTIKIIEAGFSKNEILGKPRSYDWDWPQ